MLIEMMMLEREVCVGRDSGAAGLINVANGGRFNNVVVVGAC